MVRKREEKNIDRYMVSTGGVRGGWEKKIHSSPEEGYTWGLREDMNDMVLNRGHKGKDLMREGDEIWQNRVTEERERNFYMVPLRLENRKSQPRMAGGGDHKS